MFADRDDFASVHWPYPQYQPPGPLVIACHHAECRDFDPSRGTCLLDDHEAQLDAIDEMDSRKDAHD